MHLLYLLRSTHIVSLLHDSPLSGFLAAMCVNLRKPIRDGLGVNLVSTLGQCFMKYINIFEIYEHILI